MKSKGFTLIELLAVIIILAIILAIAVPSISNIINSSTKLAFESDAKMVLKSADYKKLENNLFDIKNVTISNLFSLLGLSSDNYTSLNITIEENVPVISIVGKNKWNGLVACGTYQNMKIVSSLSECTSDVIPPVITITGGNIININQGDSYTDLGATATDNRDGDITSKIAVTSNVNPSFPGSYTVAYSVTDVAGNIGTTTRTVNVVDNVVPIVSFETNGNTSYGKSRSTVVNVADAGGIDVLKYLWNTSTTKPAESNFSTSFTNGSTISTPVGVTGSYYL
jgi:prepilin-type N-terminal cleavage/methylation domain-containing protein